VYLFKELLSYGGDKIGQELGRDSDMRCMVFPVITLRPKNDTHRMSIIIINIKKILKISLFIYL